MNDDFLTKFNKPPRPEFAAELYQRISKPMQPQKRYSILRSTSLTLAGFLLLAALALTISPIRAFAEGIFHSVGGFTFSQGVPDPNIAKVPDQIKIDRQKDSVSLQVAKGLPSAQDAGRASGLAGFVVMTPSYLPAGFSDMGDWYITDESIGKNVTHAYRDATNNFLVINQLKHSAGQPAQKYVEEQLVEVSVHGLPGVWIPGVANDPGAKKALVWEENGVTYSIITAGEMLSQAEILKVAESIGK